MKEVFYGYLIDQIGPAYYNILHPSTQGTNQAGTSHQEVALAKSDDAQAIQNLSKQIQGVTTNQMQYNPRSSMQHVQQPTGQVQNQMVNFGTSSQIPPSAQKIASSVQRIRRDTDLNVFNKRFQAVNKQGARQIDIPQEYHYGLDYNTLNMIPNPGYQDTQNFNLQMGQ